MIICLNFGQGAGAIAVKNKSITPQDGFPLLQNTLKRQGVILYKKAVDMTEIEKLVEFRGYKIGHKTY
jgi:hypothetical protein